MSAIIPVPKTAIDIRVATAADQPFIDGLQKMHTHMVGWMPSKQIEGKIAAGQVLVAEGNSALGARSSGEANSPNAEPRNPSADLLGYVISQDQYAGRDDVGIIYQLNVLPLRQRNLIGATLIKSVFERAAYGCRLFCLWCAQDIGANWFWESIGFVPLAFRTGSASKQRTHIFWERRVREGDTTTPWWFPSQTKSGAIREDRLVLPIPPGVHWRDSMPVLLPQLAAEGAPAESLTLPGGAPVCPRPQQPKLSRAQKATIQRAQSKHLKGVPLGKKAVLTSNGIKYIDRTDYVAETDAPDELAAPVTPKREKKAKAKNDPRQIAAARELRDRFLEEVNANSGALPGARKYEVGRLSSRGPKAGGEAVALPSPQRMLPAA